MPYIKLEDRKALIERRPKNAGELNYYMHILLEQYVEELGESYQTYNDIMGALEGVKQEFYRRKAAPYEDKKIAENGDINFYQQ